MRKTEISAVSEGSIAEELGIKTGDFLTSINGCEIKDIFDYRFHTADSELILEIQKQSGESWVYEIEKDEAEDIGLEFCHPLIDEEKSCRNKCVFCFIDQLPKGMRETLYFKDDDVRLSFLYGNYVTLTNIADDEIDRIIKYRMSPVNVSVHATNPALRMKMLNNRFAGDVLNKIKRFISGGITVNCQIVLCPGLNDGSELDKTISDLSGLYPGMHSISVVPVGLTRFREGLYDLTPFNKNSAHEVLKQVEGWQNKLLKLYGSRIVYPADELYLMSGKPLPGYEAYEDFPQIENGVGMVSSFVYEAKQEISDAESGIKIKKTISIATGISFFPILEQVAELIENAIDGVSFHIYPVINRYFGENVTVSGLLTGCDIIGQLKDKELGDVLYLCRSMFRSGTETLLDGLSLSDISRELDIRVEIVENDGHSFVGSVIGVPL